MDTNQVLIVEDNIDILEAMSMAIECEGYSVLTAPNGRAALDLLSSLKIAPGLIFLDLMMPVMDGWTFSEEIKKDTKLSEIPIVIVSAFSDKAKMPKNANDILEKPMDFNRLLRILKKYCITH